MWMANLKGIPTNGKSPVRDRPDDDELPSIGLVNAEIGAVSPAMNDLRKRDESDVKAA
jgi:hypothetical protein